MFNRTPATDRLTHEPRKRSVIPRSVLGSAPIRILRLAEVLNATGLGKTKIYELQATGAFPMRIRLTEHSVGWVEAEVQAWLAERVARPRKASLVDRP